MYNVLNNSNSVNNLYDKQKYEDVFEEYFYNRFLHFWCDGDVTTTLESSYTDGVATSGRSENCGASHEDLIYKSCKFGNKVYTTWTSTSNGQISSPKEANGKRRIRKHSPRQPTSEDSGDSNRSKVFESMELKHSSGLFYKNSFLPKFNSYPINARWIKGGTILHSGQTNKNGSSKDTELTEKIYGNNPFTQLRSTLQSISNQYKQNPAGLNSYNLLRPICRFCFKNREPELVYTSHETKASDGTVTCPILRRYTCDLCGATGAYSHTRKYCPLYEGFIKGQYGKLAKAYNLL
ncbi:uncharacterized protein nanos [Euwallacea similis]|uniref:uncharacterized protein nanos n=1 Tax=Euwallacea similis TaxID=1736056 RepID=UPI00344BA0FD